MILIFGGAWQGKLDYALERFSASAGDVRFCPDGDVTPPSALIIHGFEKWILALVDAGRDVKAETAAFIEACPDAVVISRDISCGVVPVEARLRAWRDETGCALAMVAGASSEAVRMFCGIPSRVK